MSSIFYSRVRKRSSTSWISTWRYMELSTMRRSDHQRCQLLSRTMVCCLSVSCSSFSGRLRWVVSGAVMKSWIQPYFLFLHLLRGLFFLSSFLSALVFPTRALLPWRPSPTAASSCSPGSTPLTVPSTMTSSEESPPPGRCTNLKLDP